MAEPALETKDTAKKMSLGGVGKSLLGGAKKSVIKTVDFLHKKFGSTEHITEGPNLSNTEYLGEIFKMMKIMDKDKKLNHEMANNHLEEEERKKDLRNKEIIQALTGKKFKKTKFKSKLKSKTNKKITAAKVSESAGGLSLGTLGTIAMGTAAVVGTGAVLMSAPQKAFANTMKMEQSVDVNDPKSAESKAKERALDTDNSYSYGVFGLSSIRKGDKESSLDSFIRENPQFKLSDPGNGGKNEKFYEEWNALDSKQLLDAQEKWWIKHVYDPTVATLESSGIPSEISTDDRVRAYMSDRANQTGDSDEAVKKTITKAGADKSTTAEGFIDKMSDYDLANLDKKFGKHLKQFPENKNGLINRIENRRKLSLSLNSNNEVKAIKKQPSSVEDLKIKENAPTIQKSLNETEAQVQKSNNAQDVIELQRKMAGPESSSSSIPKSSKSPSNSSNASNVFKLAQIELQSSGQIIPKSTIAPSDAEIARQQQKERLTQLRNESTAGVEIPYGQSKLYQEDLDRDKRYIEEVLKPQEEKELLKKQIAENQFDAMRRLEELAKAQTPNVTNTPTQPVGEDEGTDKSVWETKAMELDLNDGPVTGSSQRNTIEGKDLERK
jgi:hypothetical protein